MKIDKDKSVKEVKTITISLPIEMGREIQRIATEEHRTVSELIRESFRQYKARRAFASVSQQARFAVKEKGLTQNDFGGPFEE